MKQLQKVFDYQGSELRTVVLDNEPWFVAKDVCEILEITNPTMALQRLDNDERAKFNLGVKVKQILLMNLASIH